MRGVAGFVHLDGAPASAATLKRMTDVIAHRGPDGEGGAAFLFGSEVKALIEGGLKAALDAEALLEYFTFQNYLTPRSLFAGVRLVPAGSYLTIAQGDAAPALTRYWDFDFREPSA